MAMSPNLGRFGLSLRRALSTMVLLVVSVSGAALVLNGHDVEVLVDGDLVAVRAYGGTVGDVLERLDVQLAEADGVSRDLAAPVDDSMFVEVVRASTIDVVVDGTLERRVVAPVGSVAGTLIAAGLGDVRSRGAVIVPAWTAPVADGDVVEVWLPNEITVTVSGFEFEVTTFADDVDQLLDEHGIEVGALDELNVDPNTSLDVVSEVVVVRGEHLIDTEEVVLAHEEQRRETGALERGTTRVEQEGVDGLRRDTYRATVVDGEVRERELVHQEVVDEPRPRIVLVGTADPEPAGDPVPVGGDDAPTPTAPPGAPAADDSVWDRLAACESRGNWSAVSANGMYYGGLQFHPDTWRRVGGSGMPHEASREEQIHRGQILQARSGWGQWPSCSRRLELR